VNWAACKLVGLASVLKLLGGDLALQIVTRTVLDQRGWRTARGCGQRDRAWERHAIPWPVSSTYIISAW